MRELIFSLTRKEFEFEPFKASGPGGQHRNKVMTAMRCYHRPSGAVGEAKESRKQIDNKRTAFKRMAQTHEFQLWLKEKAHGMVPIDQLVDAMMTPENIKVEIRVANRWLEIQ